MILKYNLMFKNHFLIELALNAKRGIVMEIMTY